MKNLGKLSACVAAASLVFALSACSGGSTTGTTEKSDQGQNNGGVISGTGDEGFDGGTLTIDGVEYTCEQVLGVSSENSCTDTDEKAFLQYKGNLSAYMQSGKLGMFNVDGTFEDVAYSGFNACVILMLGKDENAYIDSMRSDPKLAEMADKDGMSRTAFLAPWFEAQKSLCPDLALSGHRTSDYITP